MLGGFLGFGDTARPGLETDGSEQGSGSMEGTPGRLWSTATNLEQL